MKRWEMLQAVDGLDTKIENTLRDNNRDLNVLERIFSLEESDLVLGAGYVRGDFDSIASICIKEVVDERRCGRLGNFSLNYLIPLAIENEYLGRGQKQLPNGDEIAARNIRKMLSESSE